MNSKVRINDCPAIAFLVGREKKSSQGDYHGIGEATGKFTCAGKGCFFPNPTQHILFTSESPMVSFFYHLYLRLSLKLSGGNTVYWWKEGFMVLAQSIQLHLSHKKFGIEMSSSSMQIYKILTFVMW